MFALAWLLQLGILPNTNHFAGFIECFIVALAPTGFPSNLKDKILQQKWGWSSGEGDGFMSDYEIYRIFYDFWLDELTPVLSLSVFLLNC